MDSKELLVTYQALMSENNDLKEEIKRLKTQLGFQESQAICNEFSEHKTGLKIVVQESKKYLCVG